ncbi:ESX-1 secretion-associated protein [Mycobacterium sp. 4D054]|uniref:ESX-1 secretion-associated protein n=1 Tax=unclassified Mycobacterium TaxID=2642494 RepID=UPI0021B18C94|nr:ESX-1 secretion-associated protein [Mycobacterium sp. SMC-8]UXA12160.1 ESX-1 secretion-associated protein [Mycobacterium sp. SMC-8]
MTEPLSVDTRGVRSLGEVHRNVADGLGSLVAGSPGPAAVAQSHGSIAAAVDTALAGALSSRSGTMSTTQAAGDTISELLRQAALAYERGDKRGAEAIRAAADHMSRSERGAGPAGTAGGAADPLGQAVGQLGQLGQVGQQLAAPIAALAQPFAQLPQLLTQGLAQGFAQAGQASAATGVPGAGAVSDAPEVPGAPEVADPGRDADRAEQDPEDERRADRDGEVAGDAAPATPPGFGAAPQPAPPPRPAPTRPAVG